MCWSFWNSSAGTELKIPWPFAVISPGQRTVHSDFTYASDLISFIKEQGKFFTFWRPAIRKAIPNQKA